MASRDCPSRVRVGFIGCGRATRTLHLPALRHLRDVRVVALADTDPAALDAAVSEAGTEVTRYGDAAQLVADEEVDVVAVCVPPLHHEEWAVAALSAGRSLYLEKPITLDLAAADRIRAAAGDAIVTMGFNYRSHRLVLRAREAIRAGRLGTLEFMRTVFSGDIRRHREMPAWRGRRTGGGGVLLELGVHHFDLVRYLTGEEFQAVHAWTRSEAWDDATAVVTGELTGGAGVGLTMSERAGSRFELEFYGRDGRLRLDCQRFDGLEVVPATTPPGGFGGMARAVAGTAAALPGALSRARSGGDFLGSYIEHWRRFAARVAADDRGVPVLDEGRRGLEVALAAVRSAVTGVPVAVADAPVNVAEAMAS